MATEIQTRRSIIDRLGETWSAGQFGSLGEVYTADAVLEAYVPGAPALQRGLSRIIGQFAHWYPEGGPRHFGWYVQPTEFGAIVEAEEIQGEGPTEIYFRWVNLLYREGDRISRHVIYCPGALDPELGAHLKASR